MFSPFSPLNPFVLPEKVVAILNEFTRMWLPIVVLLIGIGIFIAGDVLGLLFIGVALGIWVERDDVTYTREYQDYMLAVDDQEIENPAEKVKQ